MLGELYGELSTGFCYFSGIDLTFRYRTSASGRGDLRHARRCRQILATVEIGGKQFCNAAATTRRPSWRSGSTSELEEVSVDFASVRKGGPSAEHGRGSIGVIRDASNSDPSGRAPPRGLKGDFRHTVFI